MRREDVQLLQGQTFDLLIIGGGINGAGVARDAAMRGLRVALVEQNDFASGTSSRSSRLIHGGVRYLEHGEIGLVFESSQERRTLLRIAPHLVRPLSFVWPVYRGARIPRWKLALGLTAYDMLALFRNVGRHVRLSLEQVLEREPRLARDGLTGGAQYWDAATDDARLTLSNVTSAQQAGAVVLNHARVDSLLRDGERVVGARVIDTESGDSFDVGARVVVNASGPWSDHVEGMARAGPVAGVRGSKGVHVCVPRARIGNMNALTLIAPEDGRVMFVLPAGDFAIVGTTDTYDAVAPENVRATTGDVAYLLAAANRYFPGARLTDLDVVSAWAGIRPLAVMAKGVTDPGSAPREHAISETSPGLVRVTGGKLTTYRSMSREVVDVVQGSLGVRPTQCETARRALPGGDITDLPLEVAAAIRASSDAAVGVRLVHAYGSGWRDVWALAERDATLRERITPERPYLIAELRHAAEHELARTLGDLLIRRIPLAFETRDHGLTAARRVAPVVAEWMGWNSSQTAAALVAYDEEVAGIFGIEKT